MEAISIIQHNGIAASGVAFAAGLACANIPLLVQKFIQLPLVSGWIKKNPAVAQAIVDELKKDVDEVVRENNASKTSEAPKAS